MGSEKRGQNLIVAMVNTPLRGSFRSIGGEGRRKKGLHGVVLSKGEHEWGEKLTSLLYWTVSTQQQKKKEEQNRKGSSQKAPRGLRGEKKRSPWGK